MSVASPAAAGRGGAQRHSESPDAAALAALAGEHLDLVQAPFTLPRSRLLVFREGDGVRVHTSEYERSLDECRVLDTLVVCDATGRRLPITPGMLCDVEIVTGKKSVLSYLLKPVLKVSGSALTER